MSCAIHAVNYQLALERLERLGGHALAEDIRIETTVNELLAAEIQRQDRAKATGKFPCTVEDTACPPSGDEELTRLLIAAGARARELNDTQAGSVISILIEEVAELDAAITTGTDAEILAEAVQVAACATRLVTRLVRAQRLREGGAR